MLSYVLLLYNLNMLLTLKMSKTPISAFTSVTGSNRYLSTASWMISVFINLPDITHILEPYISDCKLTLLAYCLKTQLINYWFFYERNDYLPEIVQNQEDLLGVI